MSSTDAPTKTNRFLEVIRGFQERSVVPSTGIASTKTKTPITTTSSSSSSGQKRCRSEAADRFASLASTLLWTSSSNSHRSLTTKRMKKNTIGQDEQSVSTEEATANDDEKKTKEEEPITKDPSSKDISDQKMEGSDCVKGREEDKSSSKDDGDLKQSKDSADTAKNVNQHQPQSLPEDLTLADLERCRETFRQQQAELQEMEETKKKMLQEVVDVWGAYRYGLTQIANLTDLSEAPDAIMPGNF